MSKVMMNAKRAEWAEATVRSFMRETGSDAETAVGDLLTNIRHLCQQKPEMYGHFEEELAQSAETHRIEVTEDANLEYDKRIDELVVSRGVSQAVAWDPSAYVGFSEEQIALIKKGFDHALNHAYALERSADASLAGRLKEVEGGVSIHKGMMHFEDGTSLDLGNIEQASSDAKASRILISVRGGVVQEVISDAAARVCVLDHDTDGCGMVSVVDGKVVDIQEPSVVTEPTRLARMWGQATDSELISIHDLDDVEFEVETDFDMSGSATHEGPFFTASFSISRNEPDTSDDDRRSVCTLVTEITASDGRSYKAEEEITVGDDGIRSELDEIISPLDTQEALGEFLDDKIRTLNFSKKPSRRSLGM